MVTYEHLIDPGGHLPRDDMGFRTGTLIGPAHLRRWCCPGTSASQMTHAAACPTSCILRQPRDWED
jgi:hypothetical protein